MYFFGSIVLMLDSLKLIFERLLANVKIDHYRFLYHNFDLSNRLIGLVGPRGVGKTTLLLQLIKNHLINKKRVFYFSADHIYFEKISLYKFIEEMYLTEGTEIFFIDEIHKYPRWDRELKNLYDGFPKLRLIFSGSSSLDLVKGSYDLSRRAKMYYLPGMSFREYLNFSLEENLKSFSFNEFLENYKKLDSIIAKVPKIKGHFQAYCSHGFYPFLFEDPLSYHERIWRVIEKTIYEDVSGFYSLKTENLHIFKKILFFIAGIKPGGVSIHNLAKNLSVDDKTILNYLNILQESGLVTMIYPAGVGNQSLRRPEKFFLSNTNLYFSLESQLSSHDSELGTIRELFFLQSLTGAGIDVSHSKSGDFAVGKTIFEIGGKNKTQKQIKGLKQAFIVKDDIFISRGREIPLLFFGFLY